MKKCIAALLSILLAIGAPTFVGATDIAAPTCSFSSEIEDYRFLRTDEMAIKLTVKNNDTQNRSFSLSYYVTDTNGVWQWEGSSRLDTIYDGTTKSATIKPTLSDYGNYILKVTVLDENSAAYKYERSFSYVPECRITSDFAGNIFTDAENIKLTCTIGNTAAKTHTFSAVYEIFDEKGNSIYNARENLSQNSGDVNTKTIIPTIGRFGIYTLKVTLTDGYNRTYIYEKEFSYVNAAKGSDRKETSGIVTRMLSVGTPDVDKSMQITGNLGLGVINDGIRWYEYEQAQGVYGLSDTKKARLEKEISFAKESNVTLMICFHGENSLYNTANKIPRDTQSLEALQKAAQSLAAEYKGKIDIFSFTNEPDLSRRQDVLSCADYATALTYFAKGIKSGNPNAKVIGANVSQINTEWIEGVIKEGGGEYIDAVSIHPYQGPGSPESFKWAESVSKVKAMLAKNGYSNLQVIATEGNSPSSKAYNTELQQGFNLVRTYALAEATDCLDIYMPHQLFSLIKSSDDENGYGIIRSWGDPNNPYAAKSAYLQVCNFSALTAGKENTGMLCEGGVYVHHYKDADGQDLLMMYADDTVKEASLQINTPSGKIYDHYGNSETINSIDGKYTFVLSDTPTYFEGNFTSASLCEGTLKIDRVFFEMTKGSTEGVRISVPNLENYSVSVEGPAQIRTQTTTDTNTAVVNMTVADIPQKFDFTAKRQLYGTQEYRDYVTVYVRKDNKIYAKLPIAVDYIDKSADVTMLVRPKAGSEAIWEAVVNVRNNNSSESICGNITFSRPAAVSAISFVVEEIKPFAEKSYIFDLPQGLSETHLWCVGNLALDNGENIAFQLGGHPRSYYYSSGQWTRVPPLYTIRHTQKDDIVIDGVIDEEEWSENLVTEFNEASKNSSSGSDEQRPDDTTTDTDDYVDTTTEDFSGNLYAVRDGDYLYVAAEVNDNIHNQSEVPAQMSKSDSIYVTVMNNTLQSQNSKFAIGLTDFSGEAKSVINTCWSTVPSQSYKGIIDQEESGAQASIKRTDGKTVYEAKIPWTRLFGSIDAPEGNFKLTLGVNDYDVKGTSSKSYAFTRWVHLAEKTNSGIILTNSRGSNIESISEINGAETVNVKAYIPNTADESNLYFAQYSQNGLLGVKKTNGAGKRLLLADFENCETSGSIAVTSDKADLSTTSSNKGRLAVKTDENANKYLYYKTEGFDNVGVTSKPGYKIKFSEDITKGIVTLSFDIGRGSNEGGNFTNADNTTTEDFMLVRDSFSAKRWFFYAGAKEGIMCSGKDDNASADKTSVKAFKKNKIYHVDIVFDRDNKKQITFIDGERVNDMPYDRALNGSSIAFYISWSVGYLDNICVTHMESSGKEEISYDDISSRSFSATIHNDVKKIKIFGFGSKDLVPIFKEYILD